ncbi:MAG: ABC transporter permease subunit [Verrucomicrobiia bacterium]|jgi:ABC-type glycerol-3-phosphate transport system permease component
MSEPSPIQRSDAYYKLAEFSRASWIYVLLIVGAIIFSWPFLWMATTSIKIDREMFGEKIHLWPHRPIPQVKSPYIDQRFYDDVTGKHMDELLATIEVDLQNMDPSVWPDDVDRNIAIKQVARGCFHKLLDTMPSSFWDGPTEALKAEATNRVDAGMVREILAQIRRHFSLGQLRARSYGRLGPIAEDQLVSGTNAATAWQIGGTATTKLVEVNTSDEGEPYADVDYDFSTGDTLTLSQTFTTSFPIQDFYRLQLYLRNDDSWHGLTMYIEKLGVRYKAVETYDLGDFTWGIGTWQERGPDDKTNKVRTWTVLEEVGRGPQYESDPHKIKVTLELQRNSALAAWWVKARRNYRFALQNIPFFRYVATSLFLVTLNLVGTLLSCSLVAYSFARLQWPGRNFCFALMLATMMVPGQVTMIPYFLIVRSLGWYNTLYPLWVGSFFASAFNVFLLRQFLKGIPRDLEDAAKIDGCGFWRVYWHIMLPLIKPTLAAIAIFTFMGTWNEFMGPLIYLQDQRLYPLALGLYAFQVSAGGSMGMMMAGSLLMTTPVIIIFFFAQKYFIQGVTLTGMKG